MSAAFGADSCGEGMGKSGSDGGWAAYRFLTASHGAASGRNLLDIPDSFSTST